MKINPFEVDENVNYIHPGVSNDRDISSRVFPDQNLTSFDLNELGSRQVKGKPFSWKCIHTSTYIYYILELQQAQNLQVITINGELQRGRGRSKLGDTCERSRKYYG